MTHEKDILEEYRENLLHAIEKLAYYKSIGDTYQDMPWDELTDILRRNDFERILTYTIQPYKLTNMAEYFSLWAHHDKGLLLRAVSAFGMQTPNSITLHFEISVPQPRETLNLFEIRTLNNVLWESTHFPINKRPKSEGYTEIIRKSVPEGLITYIQDIENSGFKTNNSWKYFDKHLCCLLDPIDLKETNYYTLPRLNKIKARILPEKTRRMLGLIK